MIHAITYLFDGFWPSLCSNLVCASIIAIFAGVAGWKLRSPSVAHVLWILVLLKLITPPVLPLAIPIPIWIAQSGWPANSWQASVRGVAEQRAVAGHEPFMPSSSNSAFEIRSGLGSSSITTSQVVSSKQPRHDSFAFGIAPAITIAAAGIWCSIALLLLVKSLMRSWQFSRFVQQRGRDCQAADDILSELASRSGVSSVPRVKLIAAKVSPMLLGIGPWKRIVCPESLWNELDIDARSAFLAHELGHFHRKDHWVRCIELIVGSLFWWLPLVRLARKQIERMEETCCDSWAARCLALGPRTYAESLLVVVDFLSDQGSSMPQLATGMTPSKTLEERLRTIMSARPLDELTRSKSGLLGIISIFILSIQITTVSDASNLSFSLDSLETTSAERVLESSSLRSEVVGTSIGNESSDSSRGLALPEPPQGWWNRSVESTTFEFALEFDHSVLEVHPMHSLHYVLKAGRGRLQSRHWIPEREPTAMLTLYEGKRLILANRHGELRIWDTQSQQSVSLLGSHQSAIQSIAYHPEQGLLAADHRGNLIRWDIQSGAIHDSWSSEGVPIQSVRFNRTGSMFAIVLSDWKQQNEQGATVVIFDSISMTQRDRFPIESPVAIVVADGSEWLSIDWNGEVGRLDRFSKTRSSIGVLPKSDLMRILFMQDVPLPTLLP